MEHIYDRRRVLPGLFAPFQKGMEQRIVGFSLSEKFISRYEIGVMYGS